MLSAADSDLARGGSTLLQSDSQPSLISAFLGLLESPPLPHPQTGMGLTRPAGLTEQAPAEPLGVTHTGRAHRMTHFLTQGRERGSQQGERLVRQLGAFQDSS